ncbi:MAG: DUF1302 family protein [bacterium]
MSRRAWSVVTVVCGLLILGIATGGHAFYVDTAKTLEISGKVSTRATIRLQESEGFTFPETDVGDLVQHRNLGLIEIDHDLANLTEDLDILYPFRALDVAVKYHILGRFMYEGIYDYGPEVFQDVADNDPDNFDRFKQSYDLWEAYADFSRGPVFVRIGRQILAWGETDVFRLLDGINPLDNTFGGFFEDLDDRRIPLWMLRSSVNFGDLGALHTITLEGFLVPGPIDAHVSPFAPYGSPYAAPLPEFIAPSIRIKTPNRAWSESRWGARVQALIGSNLNLSIAHYQTFMDMPSLRSVILGNPAVLADLNALQLWGEFPEVRITGASFNYWESFTDLVFRGEVAWFWGAPVFIPELTSAPFYGPTLPLPDAVLDGLEEILGLDIRDLGLDGLPLNPQSGTIPRKDMLKYMIGFDKNIWIRPLNKKSTFFVSGQYFGRYVPKFDHRMRQGALIYPSLSAYPYEDKFEHTFTLLLSSTYMKGNLLPQVSAAYDPQGAIMVQPQATYIWDPLRFTVQYTNIMGSWNSMAFFRDRDQISFIFSYLLN